MPEQTVEPTVENTKNDNGTEQIKIDPSELFHTGRKEGIEKADRRTIEILSKRFGVANFDELESKISELGDTKKKPIEPSPEILQKLDLLSGENQTLKKELETQKTEIQRNSMLATISNEVNRQNPLNPKAAQMVVNDIFNNYDIAADGMITKKGTKEPHFDNENRRATIGTLIADMKKNDFSFAFGRTTGMDHINSNENEHNESAKKYIVQRGQLQIAGFKKALVDSGQIDKVMNVEAIDLTIIPDYKKYINI